MTDTQLSELLARPDLWPLLVAVPALALFWRAFDRRRARRLATLAGRHVVAADAAARGQRRALAVAGLACALVALLRPQWGLDETGAESRGVDVVVCLDVSRSMLARDLPPDRLTRAKEALVDLAARARGDRLALVAFAGEARLLVPLTDDLDTFAQLVALAEPRSVPRGGTDLGAALDAALEALEGATGDHATIVVVTDGEDLEQRGMNAAARAAERGIVVHTVGFGSLLGAKIAIDTPRGMTFVRDGAGNEVVTTMDPASLRAIAERTGGAYLDGAADERPLVALYEDRVLALAGRAYDVDERPPRKDRYRWPLAAAILCWLLEARVRRAEA